MIIDVAPHRSLPSPKRRRAPFFLRAFVLGAVTLVSTLAACGGQGLDGGTRRTFFVRSAIAPPVHSSQGGCVYTDDPSAASLLEGRVDLGVADEYRLTLLAQNSDATGSTTITGAHVVLKTADQTVIREFALVTTGFIGPGASAVTSVTVLDAAAREIVIGNLPIRTVMQTLVADVTLTGRDPSGGPDSTSPVFSFPFQICNGCLVDFSNGNDPTARIQPNCLRPIDPAVILPCQVGQDEVVPCQSCVATRPACNPATQ